jgi:effector-binding domain-containing protein
MSSLDVAIKMTDPIRIAEASAVAPGFGHENLAPLFQRLVPEVLGDLGIAGVRPGIMIAWYEEPAEDGSVVLHVGFDIEDQTVRDTEHVRVEDLPSIRVASVIHRGSMENIAAVYLALGAGSKTAAADWPDAAASSITSGTTSTPSGASPSCRSRSPTDGPRPCPPSLPVVQVGHTGGATRGSGQHG